MLLSFALRYARDREHAGGVVQETLLRAWRNIDKIDSDRTTTRSYLFTIARNVLTDGWRAESRRPAARRPGRDREIACLLCRAQSQDGTRGDGSTAMSASHDEIHVLLGAYVLGGLNQADRHTFEDHLATCARCREDLARSAPLPGLLRRAPQDAGAALPTALDTAGDDRPASVDRLLDQVARAHSADRRRQRAGWLVAAGVVVSAASG